MESKFFDLDYWISQIQTGIHPILEKEMLKGNNVVFKIDGDRCFTKIFLWPDTAPVVTIVFEKPTVSDEGEIDYE